MGLVNKLEDMRKEGGDAWLSVWNADATKVSLYIQASTRYCCIIAMCVYVYVHLCVFVLYG